MIVRLLPTQIGKFWDLVKPAVVEVGGRLAPGDWDLANNALHMAMAGQLQVWLGSEDNEKKEFKGVVITSATREHVSRVKTITLWLLFFYRSPCIELIREFRKVLCAYAKEEGCNTLLLHQLHDISDKVVDTWWEGRWSKRAVYTLHIEEDGGRHV